MAISLCVRIFTVIRAYIIRWSGVAVEWEQLSESQGLIHQLCLITVPIQPLKKSIFTFAVISGYKSVERSGLTQKNLSTTGQNLDILVSTVLR